MTQLLETMSPHQDSLVLEAKLLITCSRPSCFVCMTRFESWRSAAQFQQLPSSCKKKRWSKSRAKPSNCHALDVLLLANKDSRVRRLRLTTLGTWHWSTERLAKIPWAWWGGMLSARSRSSHIAPVRSSIASTGWIALRAVACGNFGSLMLALEIWKH